MKIYYSKCSNSIHENGSTPTFQEKKKKRFFHSSRFLSRASIYAMVHQMNGHISLYLFPSNSYLMASPFVVAAAQACKDHNKNNASFRSMKRSWSSNESSYGSSAATKSCVCAPATHAGSFKCRLHRVNSQGPSSPPAPQPAVSSSSTRTVEAQ